MSENDHVESKMGEDEFEDLTKLTQIQNKYSFWFRGGTPNSSKTQVINYQESIKKVCTFQTVEHFWRIYDHLKRPNEFRVTTEYHLFKEGITPTWEDSQNKLGGKWMVRLKKGIASRYWEDVVLAVIGEQFDVGPEICGAVISVRNNEDIISVWNKTADNTEAVNKIRDQLRRIWKLPAVIPIEYKRHQDSLVDKSSYRNPSMVWRAPSKFGIPATEKNSRDRDVSVGQENHGATFPKAAWKPNRAHDLGEGKDREFYKKENSANAAWGKTSQSKETDDTKFDKEDKKTVKHGLGGGWQRGINVVKSNDDNSEH